ncbi:hypothetical protein ambt_13550 [Alteromonas naphthalenivorans]|uniref:Uncharacterized protein n=1 Tax=Alteromonas naphthalenivorans TaxID=715451 RepID=F5Z4G9_ALTNA|nr:hypothetical protein ambt_13550 [Alteromonas naphthalenivorans]
MTLSILASNCFVVLALILTGQQLKDHLSIEFPVLEMEVKTRFGDNKALDVKELEEKLSQLNNLSVSAQLEGVNRFFDEHIQYATDDIVFKQKDYWATPAELFGHSRGDW